ncbi:MAG: DUF4178 domain-containing protein [Pseudomonadota bacterium]
MQQEQNCPNCGALIGTGVPGLPVVSCGFCHSLLSKAGDQLAKVGEAGRVPFDVSPIQIGTRLTVGGARGEIVGRERWAYEGGFWNEWLLQFATGEAFWVAEETGHYMIMKKVCASADELANLERVTSNKRAAMGEQIWIDGTAHFVSDIKTVRCVAVEGSLPHIIAADQPRESVDLRTKKGTVVTYQKDRDGPSVWRGSYYRLAELEPEGLRRFEQWSAPSFEAAR